MISGLLDFICGLPSEDENSVKLHADVTHLYTLFHLRGAVTDEFPPVPCDSRNPRH